MFAPYFGLLLYRSPSKSHMLQKFSFLILFNAKITAIIMIMCHVEAVISTLFDRFQTSITYRHSRIRQHNNMSSLDKTAYERRAQKAERLNANNQKVLQQLQSQPLNVIKLKTIENGLTELKKSAIEYDRLIM